MTEERYEVLEPREPREPPRRIELRVRRPNRWRWPLVFAIVMPLYSASGLLFAVHDVGLAMAVVSGVVLRSIGRPPAQSSGSSCSRPSRSRS
jgi:hypothetical protein